MGPHLEPHPRLVAHILSVVLEPLSPEIGLDEVRHSRNQTCCRIYRELGQRMSL